MADPRQDPKVSELVRRLRSTFDPCTIYLFGSRASGTARGDSDFDVMVIVPTSPEDHFERYKRARATLAGLGAAVDVLIYTQEEWNRTAPQRNSIAREVHDTGICLHAA